MRLAENMLFKYGNGKVIRVLYINQVASIVYVIDMDSNKWPYTMTKEEILTLHKNKEIVVMDEDDYSRVVLEEELSEIEKSKRDYSLDVVMYFKNTLSDEEHMYISKYRQKAMKETIAAFNISYNGLKNYLIKYFKGGRTKSSLIPNFFKCGAKGKERKVGEKKRGRPRLNNKNEGVNIDDSIKKNLKLV